MHFLHLDAWAALEAVPPFGIREPRPLYADGTPRQDVLLVRDYSRLLASTAGGAAAMGVLTVQSRLNEDGTLRQGVLLVHCCLEALGGVCGSVQAARLMQAATPYADVLQIRPAGTLYFYSRC